MWTESLIVTGLWCFAVFALSLLFFAFSKQTNASPLAKQNLRIMSRIMLMVGIILTARYLMMIARANKYNETKAAATATKVPEIKLIQKLSITGTVTNATIKTAGTNTCILVVKIDPLKDSALQYVAAIAPATHNMGQAWFVGGRVAVSFLGLDLTDGRTIPTQTWVVQ